MNNRTFPMTAAALAVFDAGEQKRKFDMAKAKSLVDLAAIGLERTRELGQLRDAFHKDTADINTREQCEHADLEYMRLMAGGGL